MSIFFLDNEINSDKQQDVDEEGTTTHGIQTLLL